MAALDPRPFVRGTPFPGTGAVPYPRAPTADAFRLPGGTWSAATLPIGVRLELRGDAHAVVVDYRTDLDDPGHYQAGTDWEVWSESALVARVPGGSGSVRLDLPGGDVVVHLPERLRPTVLGLTPVGGSLEPVPARPRWLAYGDSIVEGWIAGSAGGTWPAILGRRLGLDVCNLGYAGAARGELPSAEHLASAEAALVTISYGTNCWSTIPHTVDLLTAGLDAFLTIVRQGHPTTPIVLTTPIVRPDAETTPNRVGATLAELRAAMASHVRARGDAGITFVDGAELIDEKLLPDGIHPGEEGHRVLADRLEAALRSAVR